MQSLDPLVTNTLLPEFSRQFLDEVLEKVEITSARVDVVDGSFACSVQ